MMDMTRRATMDEAMDDPTLNSNDLRAVFEDLNRTNVLLGGQRISLKAVDDLIRTYPREIYSMVDMGCGDGDLLRRIARKYRKKGVKVRLLGIDNSENALAIAREKSGNFPEIHYQNTSLTALGQMESSHDILLCTLTLHHFSDHQIPLLLRHFTQIARIGVVINDLQRNNWAYYLFRAFSLIFIKTKIAKQDGLISIRRGFRKNELWELSKGLPGHRHTILWRWIFRYLWVIQVIGPPSHE